MAQTISAFIKKLETLGSVAFAELKQEVAQGGLKLIERGFQTESDPYGNKWKYVKEHTGHQGVLWDSGTLKAGWKTIVLGDGVRFYNTVVYAAKQNATRPMIPDAVRGLPAAWKSMVSRSFNRIVKQTLKETL